MITVYLILMILALLCFLGAAVGVVIQRGSLLGAGLFLWLLAILVKG